MPHLFHYLWFMFIDTSFVIKLKKYISRIICVIEDTADAKLETIMFFSDNSMKEKTECEV